MQAEQEAHSSRCAALRRAERSIGAVEAPQAPQRLHAGVTWPLNALEPFRDKRVLQTPIAASRDRQHCVLAGHLACVRVQQEGRSRDDNDNGTEGAV
jgi:hypothetical protein